jgi:hypothetical protein
MRNMSGRKLYVPLEKNNNAMPEEPKLSGA